MTDHKKDPRVADGQLDADRTATAGQKLDPREHNVCPHPAKCSCPCKVCVATRATR